MHLFEVPTPIDSAPFFMWRTGVMILAFAASWAAVGRRSLGSWSPLVVFGQTSLFVYWIHVELCYGVFSYAIHHSLPLAVSFPGYMAFTVALLGAAVLWQRRVRGPLIPAHMQVGLGRSGHWFRLRACRPYMPEPRHIPIAFQPVVLS